MSLHRISIQTLLVCLFAHRGFQSSNSLSVLCGARKVCILLLFKKVLNVTSNIPVTHGTHQKCILLSLPKVWIFLYQLTKKDTLSILAYSLGFNLIALRD